MGASITPMPSPSKMPISDTVINIYWSQEARHRFPCIETGETWDLTPQEKERYQSLNVPIPQRGPMARMRRLAASVSGFDLFRRGKEQIISMYDPESPAQLIPGEEWHGNTFDPMTYGVDYDAQRSFFDQWKELSLRVPRAYISQDPSNENSPWGVYDVSLKNGYFTYANVECEDILYSDISVQCKRQIDGTSNVRCEECYETIQSFDSNHLFFSERCAGSINLWFCLGCRNSHDCFGCTNLNKKSFCWLNEQLTQEEYKKRLAQLNLRDHQEVDRWKSVIRPLWDQAVRNAGANYLSEQCSGDDLASCLQVKGVSVLEGRRMHNVFAASFCKDSADLFCCNSLERSVSCIYSGEGYENKMCSLCWSCVDVEYSDLLVSCEHCFGCLGLKHKKFCVLNKQYKEEEYWPLVDRIKTEMLKRQEYGEYFPYSTSLFAYNTSHADAAFPLTQNEALKLGSRWYDFTQERAAPAKSIEELPSVLNPEQKQAITDFYRCPLSARPFRFVQPELDFHQQQQIAMPRLHPTTRRKLRFEQLQPLWLNERTCDRCRSTVYARYPKSYSSPLYCEPCYEKYVMLEEDAR